MNLAPYKGDGQPSCTKAVYLSYDGANIHLKQGGLILVNGKEVATLPVNVGDIRIRAASSLFIISKYFGLYYLTSLSVFYHIFYTIYRSFMSAMLSYPILPNLT